MIVRLSATLLAVCLAVPVAAAEFETKQQFVLKPQFDGLTLTFQALELPKGLEGVVLSVAGPRGYQATVRAGKDMPKIDLEEFGKVFDGRFQYEVTGTTGERIEVNSPIDANGRPQGQSGIRGLGAQFSGAFVVREGAVVAFDQDKEKEEEEENKN